MFVYYISGKKCAFSYISFHYFSEVDCAKQGGGEGLSQMEILSGDATAPIPRYKLFCCPLCTFLFFGFLHFVPVCFAVFHSQLHLPSYLPRMLSLLPGLPQPPCSFFSNQRKFHCTFLMQLGAVLVFFLCFFPVQMTPNLPKKQEIFWVMPDKN